MSALKKLVKQVLTEKENKRYEKLLAARRVSYDSWVRERELRLFGEAAQAKASRELAEADIRNHNGSSASEIFCMPGGRLSGQAVELIERYFTEHPEVQILYGDEDVWQGLERSNPWFKPDWSPDLFDSWYYFGSVVAVRRELLEQIPCPAEWGQGFIRWVRTCLEALGGWQPGCKAVGHIPEILFHCDGEESLKQYLQWETGNARKQPGTWECADGADTNAGVQLSVIIPSKDHPEILGKCIQTILENNKKLNYELIIVDNGSSKENKLQMEHMLQACEEEAQTGKKEKRPGMVKYIYQPMDFNFSGMCNLGAEKAAGELLLFLNDDVELCRENCLSMLAELAAREYTGAVGLKLYYPGSCRIQHAGITNLPMGPVHKLQFLEDDKDYYFNSNRGLRNVLAVTAACLMVEKKKFREVQGFSEDLQVAFNDVDFCFKLYERGYFNVCDNDCYAYHHESLSRGDDESTDKWMRLQKERDVLYSRHPALEGRDPYYGVGLGREGLDTRIRPEFETAGNKVQVLQQDRASREMGANGTHYCGGIRKLSAEELVKYRQDNCLLLRVENCRQGILQGYGVVLGDNNACYEKTLLLEAIENNKEAGILAIPMVGQYRPDLVENMPDQMNVGLSGFWMEVMSSGQSLLNKGNYRIGMTARNRVTGLQLINWSNRILTVE